MILKKNFGNGNTDFVARTTNLNGTTIPASYALYDSTGQNGNNTMIIPIKFATEYNIIGMEIYVSSGYLTPVEPTVRTITKYEEYYENGSLAGYKVTFDGPAINIKAEKHGLQPAPQNCGGCDLLGMRSGYVGKNRANFNSVQGDRGFLGECLCVYGWN